MSLERDTQGAGVENPTIEGPVEDPTTVEVSRADSEVEDSWRLACYVYGVVPADVDLPPGLTGIDGTHEVVVVRGESIAALASPVELSDFGEKALEEHLDDLAWIERHARRHEQVLARVLEQTTLVPMRMCAIYRDERSVRDMLARGHAFLADALDRLAGRTEWGVKIYVVGDPPVEVDAEEEVAAADAPDGLRGQGANYLMGKQRQGRRRERLRAVVQERCEDAHRQLGRTVVQAKLNPVQPGELSGREDPMVLNGAYLVDDAVTEEFGSLVGALRADLLEYGLGLELTGPWPPYNFVNSPIEVGR